MSQNLKKISKMGLVALFLVNFGYMADMVIVPAADSIYTEFADAPSVVLNFILSGPQLLGVLSAIFTGFFMQKIGKRQIILVEFGIFILASCGGAFIQNVWYVAFMRGMTGLAVGGLYPAGIAMINEYYEEDENTCNILVSSFSGACALLGAIMSVVAGILCVGGWTKVYEEYFLAIPIWIFMYFALPKGQKRGDDKNKEENTEEKLPRIRIIALVASLFFICTTANFMSYQNALYVAENHLGSSVLAGIYSCLITLSTCIACIIFTPIYTRLRRRMAPIIYAIVAVSFLGCGFIYGVVWSGFWIFILGIGYGFAMSYFNIYGVYIIPSSKAPTVLGWIAAANGLGAFFCTYASTLVMQIFNLKRLKDVCLIYALAMGAGCILSACLAMNCEKKGLDKKQEPF